MSHTGKIRKRLRVTQVQKLLTSITKRITEDANLTSSEFTSLTVSAAQLAATLHKLDKEHVARLKKERDDLFR